SEGADAAVARRRADVPHAGVVAGLAGGPYVRLGPIADGHVACLIERQPVALLRGIQPAGGVEGLAEDVPVVGRHRRQQLALGQAGVAQLPGAAAGESAAPQRHRESDSPSGGSHSVPPARTTKVPPSRPARGVRWSSVWWRSRRGAVLGRRITAWLRSVPTRARPPPGPRARRR